jgi:hypothetical protein
MIKPWFELVGDTRHVDALAVDMEAKSEALLKLPRSAWHTGPNPKEMLVAVLLGTHGGGTPFVGFVDQNESCQSQLVGATVAGFMVLGWMEVGE